MAKWNEGTDFLALHPAGPSNGCGGRGLRMKGGAWRERTLFPEEQQNKQTSSHTPGLLRAPSWRRRGLKAAFSGWKQGAQTPQEHFAHVERHLRTAPPSGSTLERQHGTRVAVSPEDLETTL